MQDQDIAIDVKDLTKDFLLPQEKINSLKGVFVSLFNPKINKTKQLALKDINFQVKKGEFFGIVGRNGSGKSTMLKILANIYQPTKGSIKINGKLVPFIELGVGFNAELTGRENVYLNGAMLGFSRNEVEGMYNDIVKFAELGRFMDQKLKNYSSGMQVRLAFSLAIRANADILLVDEVLAVGDAAFQRKCFNYFKELKKNKTTVVFVTHDMNSVREYCDRAIMIEKSQIIASGSADKIATTYTRMFMEEAKDENSKDNGKARDTKRWGTGAVKYQKPTVNITDDFIEFRITANVKEPVVDANFGFSVSDATGQKLLGTNSVIKKQKVAILKIDQKVEIEWRFPNILRDGDYFLDLAAVGTNNEVWDWWEEATDFKVLKEEKTTYPTQPTIDLHLKAL